MSMGIAINATTSWKPYYIQQAILIFQDFESYFQVPRSRDLYKQVRPAIAPNVHRSCATLSNKRFYDTGYSFDPIKFGAGVGDRSGELRVLTGFAFSFHLRFSSIGVVGCGSFCLIAFSREVVRRLAK